MKLNRRTMLTGLGAAGAALWVPPSAFALGLPNDTIKTIRYYRPPETGGADPALAARHQPLINQSAFVVVIETEGRLTGIGEGGDPDTMDQCASMLIGQDPFRIDHAWQMMLRGYFYPAGHEKIDALGALDLALWDLKGKTLGVPVWQMLGGKSRDYVECYSTAYPTPKGGTLEDAARACIGDGFRAYRYATNLPSNEVDRFDLVNRMYADCVLIRKGAGKDGAWAIDFHTELDPPDAITLANMIEPLHPYFVEDLIRSENPDAYAAIRERTKVPIAVGEQFGYKWDVNKLIENQWIDYARVTLPNVGGITEYMKILALAETHYVGMIPHFTGPIAEAALVHCLTASSSVAIMEMLGRGDRAFPYLKQGYDFRNGKMWPNERPGLGLELDLTKLKQVAEYKEHFAPTQLNHRPDGSFTEW
jgi:L-alanine-DL-glutamate epimerase-like enolase superfamily enzyme